ncbi:MAG: DUF1801 domain-containing protein [Parvularculaceae bacterium]|jgi:hypothetical protein|nr:DUF1801 domain-containing protein [Parvularculaceae bacterium]
MAANASAKTARTARKPAAKSASEKSGAKTKPTAVSVEAFIDKVPNETRRKDAKTLLALMKKVTGEKPVMWGSSIIGFGRYHYKYDSGREGDMCMTGFSPRSTSLVVYVLPGFARFEGLLKKLGKHRHGGSCLYINRLEDVDLPVLEKIVADAYAHMRKKYPA